MNDFWRSVATGAAIGATAYGLNQAFGRDAYAGYSLYLGGYARNGDYADFGWSFRAGASSYPRVSDWAFGGGRAVDSWAFSRGYDYGFRDGFASSYNFNGLPPYNGQYVPWWT